MLNTAVFRVKCCHSTQVREEHTEISIQTLVVFSIVYRIYFMSIVNLSWTYCYTDS